MTIAITGASGRLARIATGFVLERVPASELVLITRSPRELEHLTDQGVQVRYGSFDEPDSVTAGLAGVERMLLVSTMDVGRRIEQQRKAVDAAVAAGVGHVIYTGGQAPVPDNPAVATKEHAATEEAIRESGAAWTMLRMGLYAEFRVPQGAEAVASGRYFHNAGDGLTAYVSRIDCAAAAAGALANGGHENVAYDVTGPELLSQNDVAALLSEVSGRPVEAVEVSDEERTEQFVAAGYAPAAAASAASWGKAIRAGVLAPLTTVVQDLSGRPPRSLRDVLEEHRAELLSG